MFVSSFFLYAKISEHLENSIISPSLVHTDEQSTDEDDESSWDNLFDSLSEDAEETDEPEPDEPQNVDVEAEQPESEESTNESTRDPIIDWNNLSDDDAK